MTLKALKYSEFVGTPREWSLSEVDFHKSATLVVGKNSTGKSRLLSIIRSLAHTLAGIRKPADGNFEVSVELESGTYKYELRVHEQMVLSESLRLNGSALLERVEDQPTKIYYEQIEKFVDAQFPRDVSAVASRQDALQHPKFVEFAQWALRTAHFGFAVGFSQERVLMLSEAAQIAESAIAPKQENLPPPMAPDVIGTYVRAFGQFGEKFDKEVIKDMRHLGFPISDVGVASMKDLVPGLPIDGAMLFVEEQGIKARLPQAFMSQGMFRALALTISLNARFFGKVGGLVLIDDVGEGLDFERSSALISLLMKKGAKYESQMLMASNDRFIMNGVPIENWCVLERKGTVVTAYTYQNHRAQFEDFKSIGLSNFDFFKSGAFADSSRIQ